MPSRLLLATLVATLVGSLAWTPAALAVDETPLETPPSSACRRRSRLAPSPR